MSHQPGSVPAPEDGRPTSPLAAATRLLSRHFETWGGRYVEMRTEARRP